jgi:hypothetical protein
MKLYSLLLAFSALLLSGCVSLRQQSLVKGRPDVHLILCNDRYLLLQIGPSDVPNPYKIIATQSYIESPAHERFTIQVIPHQFDLDQKRPYVCDDIYPCDSTGSRLRRWSNGIWAVHLVMQTNGEPSVIDQQLKFWTFHYNPIIHGPPN